MGEFFQPNWNLQLVEPKRMPVRVHPQTPRGYWIASPS
jgi:hypothetical protein